jgi:hypothetical protein
MIGEPRSDPLAVDRRVRGGHGVALLAIGLLLYVQFESELNRTIDEGLRGRVDALATLVAQRAARP